MLSRDDANLVTRDRALSGLGIVLDEAAMLNIVRGLSRRTDVLRLEADYVRYKPGTSCIVGYTIECGSGRFPAYARAHAEEARGKVAKAVQRAGPSGVLGFGAAALRDPPVVLYEVPNDHELRTLPRLIEAADGRLRARDVTFGDHPIEGADVTMLRYKPERRFVGRLETPRGVYVLKIYTEEDFARTRDRGKRFKSDGPLLVIEPVGRRERHHALLFEWTQGQTLLGPAGAAVANPTDAAARIGDALQRIHRHEALFLPAGDQARVLSWLDASRASVASLDAELGECAKAIFSSVSQSIQQMEWIEAALHGDFSFDQVLLTDQGVAVLDFDRALRGHPFFDLGRFVASLELEALHGRLHVSVRDAMMAAMCESYGAPPQSRKIAIGDPLNGALAMFTAAHLLLKADEPFRLRWPAWRTEMGRLLSRAAQLSGSECVAAR